MTVDLQVPSNGIFYGCRDKLDESKIEKMGFLFFFPSNESAKINDSYPLLFFLHGMQKHDDDLEKLKIYGSPKICSGFEGAAKWYFILVVPQFPDANLGAVTHLRLLLEKIYNNYPVEESRVYVTDPSTGNWGLGRYYLRTLNTSRQPRQSVTKTIQTPQN